MSLLSMVAWSTISSIDDLKKLGSLQEVKRNFSNDLQTKITARSWKQLLAKIKVFQNVFNSSKVNSSINLTSETNSSNLLYFRSESDQAIFMLVETDGRCRQQLLGVTPNHYGDLELAKQWRRELAKLVHPDVTNHPYAANAMCNLDEMYEEMINR